MVAKLVVSAFVCTLLFLPSCRKRSDNSYLKGTFLESAPYGLTDRCDNGKAKYWGQEIMDIDLMHLYMNNLGISTTANVAIVDSGFDSTQKDSYEVIGGVKTARGIVDGDVHPTKVPPYKIVGYADTLIGDPDRDENGHGTMVSSVVGGKLLQGVAKNINLSVYRVTTAGSSGSTSTVNLQMSMHKACIENADPDGVNVVNVSWGGRFDESGTVPDEDHPEVKKLLNVFANAGCLIVKSAGNSNFRRARNYNLEDSYLRVAAVDTSLELSSFSTSGEVQAPGSDIYTYDTSLSRAYRRDDRKCGKEKNRAFVNGTSFSAPFVAGVASQVVRVLKHYGAFRRLSPPERIALLNRLLWASQLQGSINGLRAVHFAYVFAHMNEREQAEVLGSSWQKFFESKIKEYVHPICHEQAVFCSSKDSEQILRKCMNLNRTRLAICNQEVTLEQMINLAQVSFENDAFEKGYHYMRVAQSFNPSESILQNLRKKATEEYLRKLGYYDQKNWQGKIDPIKQAGVLYKMNPNFVREVSAPFLAIEAQHGRVDPEYMRRFVNATAKSYLVKSSLEMGFDPETGEDRGSGSVLKGVLSVLQTAYKVLGDKEFFRLINYMVEDEITQVDWNIKFHKERDLSLSIDESTSTFRILDGLINSPWLPQSLTSQIRKIESDLVLAVRRTNQYYASKTQSLPMYFEYYPTRATLVPALQRNLRQILVDYHNNPQVLSAVEYFFLFENFKSIPELQAKPFELPLRALRVISQGQGWGERNDHEMLERVLEHMRHQLGQKVTELQRVQTDVLNIVRESSNISFVSDILIGYGENKVFYDQIGDYSVDKEIEKRKRSEGLEYRSHPVLTPYLAQIAGMKHLAYLFSISDLTLNPSLSLQIVRSSGHIIPALYGNSSWPSVQPIAVPHASKNYIDRLNALTGQPPQKTVSSQALTLDAWVDYMIAMTRNPKTRAFGRDLITHSFRDLSSHHLMVYYNPNDPVYQVLKRMPDGPWRAKLHSFIQEAKQEKYYAGEYLLEYFLQNWERLNQH